MFQFSHHGVYFMFFPRTENVIWYHFGHSMRICCDESREMGFGMCANLEINGIYCIIGGCRVVSFIEQSVSLKLISRRWFLDTAVSLFVRFLNAAVTIFLRIRMLFENCFQTYAHRRPHQHCNRRTTPCVFMKTKYIMRVLMLRAQKKDNAHRLKHPKWVEKTALNHVWQIAHEHKLFRNSEA